jgi:hypothetical protein
MRPLPATLVFALLLCPAAAEAQSDTATLNASVNGLARLSLSSGRISFADADPDTVPFVPASPAAISITAKARATEGGEVTLTVLATDDLRSGVDTIPASAISWTASGPGFVSGTLSSTTPQLVASWPGSGVRTGSQSFRFQNLWTHPTGTYTVTMVFTLSAS